MGGSLNILMTLIAHGQWETARKKAAEYSSTLSKLASSNQAAFITEFLEEQKKDSEEMRKIIENESPDKKLAEKAVARMQKRIDRYAEDAQQATIVASYLK
jgi:hypothetical protein